MTTIKHQVSKIKIIVPLLLILPLVLIISCQKVDKPVRGEEGSSPMAIVIDGDPPESHTEIVTSEGRSLRKTGLFSSSLEGLDYWQAYHPTLVTGTHDPGLIVVSEDEEELCLDCHDQSTSCNNCHSYVGAKLITSDE